MFKKKSLAISCSLIALSTSVDALAQEVEWSIETGLGYETNIYHAPDHDYLDSALPSNRPGGVLVSPAEVSSFFIPVGAEVSVRNKAYENVDFVAGLDFDTDIMLNSNADDATRTNVDLDLGFNYDLIELKYSKKKKNYIKKDRGDAYLGMFISTHNQIYVDRDSGLPKEVGGVDISDKYSYQSVGIKGDYERKVGHNKYLVGFKYEDLNYDTPETGAEYDHVLNKLEIGLKRDFTKKTDMKVAYSYYVRDYSNRYSRDVATGTYSSVNDLLKYTYNTLALSLGHRFTKRLKTYIDIKNTNRTDEFEGYNDYSRLDINIRARYKYSDKTKIRAKIKSSQIDYKNAYNFEDQSRGDKENSGMDITVKVEHEWAKHKTYFVELDYTDRVSTDDRYDYTNNMIMLGAKWEY